MNRQARFAIALISAGLATGAAQAQTAVAEAGLQAETALTLAQSAHLPETIIAEMEAQGYTRIEVSRTLLGRTMLRATAEGKGMREVVIHPRTGEILRDVVERGKSHEAPRSDRAGGREDRGAEFGSAISGEARSGAHRESPGSMGARASGGISAEASGRAGGGGTGVEVDAGASVGVGAGVGVGGN